MKDKKSYIPICPYCGGNLVNQDRKGVPGIGCAAPNCAYWKPERQRPSKSQSEESLSFVPLSYRPTGLCDRLRLYRGT